jgi:hypothetical protein
MKPFANRKYLLHFHACIPRIHFMSIRSYGLGFLVSLFGFITPLFGKTQEVVVFVSPEGNDQKKGTTEQEAFRSLERAREEVRLIRAKENSARVVVELLPGTYPIEKTFLLQKQDGGSEGSPVAYRSRDRQKACLIGGRTFRLSEFQPVSDPALQERLAPEARDKVVCLSLSKEKISHGGPFPLKFDDQGGLFELFDSQGRMPLSRWPNEGYVTMKEVVMNGDPKTPGTFVYRDERPTRWLKNKNIWLKGQWRVGWEDPALKVASIDSTNSTITFAVGIPSGIGSKYKRPKGSGEEPWCAINLPEEIDQPGEWYGLDTLHPRRRCLHTLWHRSCDAWELPPAPRPRRAGFREWAGLGRRAAEVRSLGRRMLYTPQPAYRYRDGSRVAFY